MSSSSSSDEDNDNVRLRNLIRTNSEWSGEDEHQEEEIDYHDYYSYNEDEFEEENHQVEQLNNNDDPEYFAFECITIEEAQLMITEQVESIVKILIVSSSIAKLLLHKCLWSVSETVAKWNASDPTLLRFVISTACVKTTSRQNAKDVKCTIVCDVCYTNSMESSHLLCGHQYCKDCWELHFFHQIQRGISTGIGCMSTNCDILAHEDFVLSHISKPAVRERYKTLLFHENVRYHPNLQFCPGPNCKYLIRAASCLPKRCFCSNCKSTFCYKCGSDYHAPTSCETIKQWLTKCADDSETANYMSAHTKDCPKCGICIEKNGGCNHMQCYGCKYDFCWMCLGDWKSHGSEYYECSRYKENPHIANESIHAQAREALKKYLHYFERWENHSKSLKLEAHTLEKIKGRISRKVMEGCGTWIDWQYLIDASSLLAKCRYTLQYTYPYAYYIDLCPRKELFEYQQAQLEAEIENLSWKIEHAESTSRGNFEIQVDVAEKRRTILLKDFFSC